MWFCVFPYPEDILLATEYGLFWYIVIVEFLRKSIFLKKKSLIMGLEKSGARKF